MYPTRLEMWEAEQTMKWAWQFMMAKNHLDFSQPIQLMSLALQEMKKLRLSLYPDPPERNDE